MTPDTAHICSKGTLDSPQQFLGVSPCSWPEHLTSQFFVVVVVQSLSHVQLFATPWTAAHQASMSFSISQSLLKLMSIESMMPFNISSSVTLFSSCPQSFPASRSFPMCQFFASGGQTIRALASLSVLMLISFRKVDFL